jgi:hypothetical protein
MRRGPPGYVDAAVTHHPVGILVNQIQGDGIVNKPPHFTHPNVVSNAGVIALHVRTEDKRVFSGRRHGLKYRRFLATTPCQVGWRSESNFRPNDH